MTGPLRRALVLLLTVCTATCAVLEPRAAIITSAPVTLTVSVGATVLLPCNVSNQGDHVVVWRRGGRRVLTAGSVLVTRDPRVTLVTRDPRVTLVTRDPRVTLRQRAVATTSTGVSSGSSSTSSTSSSSNAAATISSNSLRIEQLVADDEDLYSCLLDTERLQEVVHRLHVLYGPEVSVLPASGTIIVEQGQAVNMTCVGRGRPQPQVEWRKESGLLPSGRMSVRSRDLQLTHVSRHHAGVYLCSGESSRGTQSASVVMQVQYVPEVSTPKETVYSAEGREAVLTCHVVSDPTAQVTWSRVNTPMKLNRHSLSKSEELSGSVHQLRIHPVRAEDFGQYRCLATNTLGERSRIIILSGTPDDVRVTSDPVGVKSDVFQLQWQASSYSPLLEYLITLRPKHNSSEFNEDWKKILVPSIGGVLTDGLVYSQQVALDHLKPSTRYELRVQARNKHGWSSYSEVFMFSTMPSEAALESRPDEPVSEIETSSGSYRVVTCCDLRLTSLVSALTVALARITWFA